METKPLYLPEDLRQSKLAMPEQAGRAGGWPRLLRRQSNGLSRRAILGMLLALMLLGAALGYGGLRYLYQQDRQFFDPIDDPENAALVSEFNAFLQANYIVYFDARELLTPGGSHRRVGSSGYGLNRLPPRHLWDGMLASLFVIEELRERFGGELNIISGYRAPLYNTAIGGARRSQHMRYTAFDVAPKSGKPEDVEKINKILRQMRDDEQLFVGGLGKYDNWIHIDTREKNANW